MAGHIRLVAIILATGLIAGACSDGGDPNLSSTSTPNHEIGSSSDIDTSEWRSYASPLGFELQYPPDWTLDIVSDNQMRILDLTYKKALDDAIAAGQVDVGLPPIPGASQFSVIADISQGFDVDFLIGSCGNDALRVTFLARDAVYCPGTGTVTETLTSAGQSYWVEFPAGHTMLIGGSMIWEDAPDLRVVEAILGSFEFTEAEPPPPIDTSAWPTFSSPLGFELRYPPEWTLDIVSDSQMRILSPAYQQALDDALAAGHEDVGLPPLPGASQFSVIADISQGFDVDFLIGSCGNDALRVTFLARDAVYCPGTGTLTGTLNSAGKSYWVEFPPGHTMLVGGSLISEGDPDLTIIRAILSTFTFTSDT